MLPHSIFIQYIAGELTNANDYPFGSFIIKFVHLELIENTIRILCSNVQVQNISVYAPPGSPYTVGVVPGTYDDPGICFVLFPAVN